MEKWIGNRVSYEDTPRQCTIVIQPKRSRWKEAILLAWLLGFTFVGFYMIYMLVWGIDYIDNSLIEGDPTEIKRNQKIYFAVVIAFWAYFEYKVVKGFLWLIGGRELVKITKDEMTIKNSFFGYGKATRHFTENIKNIDLVKHKTFSFGFDYENAFWRQGTDSIVFNSGSKTVGFAKKIEEKNANLLMRLIKDRIKKLRKK